MKQLLQILAPLFFSIIVYSPGISQQTAGRDPGGGIAITFDDTYVPQWCAADSLLKQYGWKATFCISHFDELPADQILQLKKLQDAGHEIAGHGLNHVRAIEYAANKGDSGYLQDEILPMIEIMQNDSFPVKSFAYPFGNRNRRLDTLLLNYFRILRGTTHGQAEPAFQNCFFTHSPVVFGIGIDSNYQHTDRYLMDLLNYARTNDKILVVYAHKPVERVTENYQVKISTLEAICRYIQDNNMRYYTLSDLAVRLE